jgi:hypothetical protein
MGPIELIAMGHYIGSYLALFLLLLFCWIIYGRIANKAGYSKFWSLIMLAFPFNLILIWIFAFTDWPLLTGTTRNKNYGKYLKEKEKMSHHKDIFTAFKKAKSIFDDPLHIEDFSSEFNLTIEQVNEMVSKGEVKAYQYGNELFIDKTTYKTT